MTKRLSLTVGNPATVIDLTVPIIAAVLTVVLSEHHSLNTVNTVRGSKVSGGESSALPPEVKVSVNPLLKGISND